ncbi:MAG: MoaD/ThiS family protein [Desulfopila sp.]
MRVTIKLFAYFRDNRFREENRDVASRTQVIDIVGGLGIDQEEVGVLMINSRQCTMETELQEGDILAIFPVVGGG